MDKKSNNIQIIKAKYVKYPFCGMASNLIDKFLIIGYDQRNIENSLQNNKRQNLRNNIDDPLKFIEFNTRPTILNEICFNYNKESQDNDQIINYIFPDYPKMLIIDKKYIKSQTGVNEEIKDYSMIFSINPQDNSGSRKSFNGLGYIFFIKKEHKTNNNEDLIIYYPITYVILSDYPYYYHFNKICKNVYIQMKKTTDEIPIDIILYNAIKFCPSPINKNINLSFGAQLSNKEKDKITVDKVIDQLFKSNNNEISSGIPFIFFSQLSGYPFIDINMSFLFNLLEPNIIIKIFIFTFLEYDVVLVSSHPSLLNTLLYIFSNLNYPFNDSIYYWHVFSVSGNDFTKGTLLSSRVSTAITGICYENPAKLNTVSKISEHILIDIDSKNISLRGSSDEIDITMFNNIKDLNDYIDKCIPNTEENTARNDEKIDQFENKRIYYNDGINLYEAITNLGLTLNRRFRIVTNTNFIESKVKPDFFTPYEGESEIDMLKENLQIQKAFYNFSVQILGTFYNEHVVEDEINEDYKVLSISINNIKKHDEKNIDEKELSFAQKAGLTFKKLFRISSKKSNYMERFLKYHDCLDTSRLPFSFFNEFFYFSKICENNHLNGIDIFTIIDQFYGKLKKIDFLEIIKEKQEESKIDNENILISLEANQRIQIINNFRNVYNFSYDEFETFYKNNLRAYINREQEDDKINFIKDQAISKLYKTYKRNNFFLSHKILEKYAIYCNNNYQQIKNFFKLYYCKEKEEKNINLQNKKGKESEYIDENNSEINNKNIIDINKKDNLIKYQNIFGTCELMEISDLIEKHLIMEKYFSCYEMLKFSLLNIIAISIGMKNRQIDNVVVIKIVIDFCFITNSLVRRYMNIFLNIFATMKLNSILNEQECNDCTNIIISYFKRTNTFPTEDTINPIIKSKSYTSKDSIEVDYKSLNDFKSNNKKIREKRAEFYQSIDEKKELEIIDYIEKVFSGWYFYSKEEHKLVTNIEYFAQKFVNLYSYLLDKKSKKKEFIPKTPLELYAITNKLLFKYLSEFYISKDDYLELGTIVLSLLYYFKMEFFLNKWILKTEGLADVININQSDKEADNNFKINTSIKEVVKSLVQNIIYILLDLFETIINNKGK